MVKRLRDSSQETLGRRVFQAGSAVACPEASEGKLAGKFDLGDLNKTKSVPYQGIYQLDFWDPSLDLLLSTVRAPCPGSTGYPYTLSLHFWAVFRAPRLLRSHILVRDTSNLQSAVLQPRLAQF